MKKLDHVETGGEQHSGKRGELLQSIAMTFRTLLWHGHKHMATDMEEIGLTLPQAVVLMALETYGGRAKMSDLARMAKGSGGTLTGIVDRLVSAGLVDRIRDESDRRLVYASLTELGKARLQAISAQRSAHMEQMAASFTDAGLEQLNVLLGKFLEAMGVEPGVAPERGSEGSRSRTF